MIGPEPKLKPGRRLRVPYLGDWGQRRLNGFAAPGLPKKIRVLARAFQNKLMAWEAVRSSAPYIVGELARYSRLSEEVDKAFAGQPILLDQSPHVQRE